MKRILYFLLAAAMLATFGCSGDDGSNFAYSITNPNPDALSPKGTVQGVLKDACTNEPIVGAVIDIGVAKATTNEAGQYVMHNVPATSFVATEDDGRRSGFRGEYSATIDLRKAKNVLNASAQYPAFSYDEVEVIFSSLNDTEGDEDGAGSGSNHDTPVVNLGNGDFDFSIGQVKTAISGIAVTADLKPVPDGYTVKLFSLGSSWDGNTSTGNFLHLIATTTTVNGKFTFSGLEAKQFFGISVVDTDTDVPTMWGIGVKATKCAGTTWFGVQDGEPIIVGSTDDMCPFITSSSPANGADLDPTVEGGINVTFTFSEPIKANVHNTDRGLTPSDLSGLYQDVYVEYLGNKQMVMAGNIAHSLSWNADMTVLTVNIPVVGAASAYRVTLTNGHGTLKDAVGNSLAAGLYDYCGSFSSLTKSFTTYGAAAAGQPTLTVLNATTLDYNTPIQLTWQEVAGAKYYKLYCATNQVWGSTVNEHPFAQVGGNIYGTTATIFPTVPYQFVENLSIKLEKECYLVGVDADNLEGPASASVTAEDVVAPQITGTNLATQIGLQADNFWVSFSEPMVKSQVENVANWTLNPDAFIGTAVTVTSVVYDEDAFVAYVTLSGNLEEIQMGSISNGPNGVTETEARLTDDQVLAFGAGAPNTACVTAATDHVVGTTAVNDDNQRINVLEPALIGQIIIDSGGNGICETAAAATVEAQTLPLGQGLPNQVAVTAGIGFILNAVPNTTALGVATGGDDTLANAPVFVTVTATDVAGNALDAAHNAIGTDNVIQ